MFIYHQNVCFGIMNSCWLSRVSTVPVGKELMCVCFKQHVNSRVPAAVVHFHFICEWEMNWLVQTQMYIIICFVCCIMAGRWNLQVWWREVHKELLRSDFLQC